jgi:hypothetical protein
LSGESHETLSPDARERARYYAAERVPDQAESGMVAVRIAVSCRPIA